MQPLLDAPPPVHPYAPGSGARRRPTSWSPATAAGTARGWRHERRRRPPQGRTAAPQSAAAPSPFPPIADYAFLSDCHTGALVAPDGAIDWLCVPRFDSPSVFGSLLDREAGTFRLGAVRHQPPVRARTTSRAPTSLVTTWKTPSGWVEVRDALTIGPARRRGHDHAAHPAAGRRRRRPHARAHGRVPRRAGRDRAGLRAGVRLRPRRRRTWTLVDDDRHAADASGAGRDASGCSTDLALGIEGRPGPGPPRARGGRAGVLRAVLGRGARGAGGRRRGCDAARAPRRASGGDWLGRARIPDHRWRDPIQRSALAIKGLTYMPTGATVAALTTSLPETPGGERNWDYRYTWMRDSTFTLQALHWLNLDWEADEFMQFVADLEPNEDGALQIMYGIDGRRDLTESTLDDLVRLRRRAAGADRQRRVRPAPERRLRRGAGLDPAAHAAQPAAAAAAVADRAGPGRVRDAASGASPTRASGRRAASRSTTSRRSSCAGSRSTGRPSWPRSAATASSAPTLARDGRGDPGRHPRARRQRARRPAPALRHRRARRLDAAGRDLRASSPATTSACARRCSRSPTS